MADISRALVESVARGLDVAHEFLDGVEDLGGHIGLIQKAFNGVQQARLRRFLRALAAREQELTDEEREQLYKRLDTRAGRELLVDAVDAVIRTNSKRAAAALGLLIGDPSGERFNPSFRRNACEALRGLSDDQVDLFLALLRIAREVPQQSQRTIQGDEYVTDIGIWHAAANAQGVSLLIQPLYARLGLDPWTIRSRTNQLITRGLLLPDVGTRVDTQEYLTFAFGGESLLFEDLFVRARGAIGPDGDDSELSR